MPLNARYIVPQLLTGDDTESYGNSCECYRRYHFTTDALPFFGFATLALFLLLLCALLSGLTLAVCSLDIVWLQVMSVTANKRQRNQAIKVSRIKRNSTWFLCKQYRYPESSVMANVVLAASMIICSVACTEALPILVQSLCGTAWLPLVLSTIAVAVFAELIPQYIIPRNAFFWAYHCWPFIWGCMWLTCIISWPISFILDRIAWPCVNRGIHTSEQLGVLIKFHERSERHGGHLGPDAGRIMRGALDLDGRLVQGTDSAYFEKGKAPEADLERGNATKYDIIVPWTAVRLININEEVTIEFITKVREWAYSRIPVVGDDVVAACNAPVEPERSWKGQKVYGFLHIKNLIGLELLDRNSKRLLVKDLPLYPLPIVRDDLPLYDLLNMFQLGMSRMAVVTTRPVKDRLVPLSASAKNKDALPRHSAPLWSAAAGLKNRNTIEMRALDAQIDWTTDFLDAAQNDTRMPAHRKHSVIGIGCPNPIGIVTYEDVIDSLLQKTSLDEKDFFDRYNSTLHSKAKKAGDDTSVSSNRSIIRMKRAVPSCVAEAHATLENAGENQSTLRRRNISTAVAGNDGANDTNDFASDGAENQGILHAQDVVGSSSSYTQNSLGGFHKMCESMDDIENTITQSLNTLIYSKVTQGLSAKPTIPAVDLLPSNPSISSLDPLAKNSRRQLTATMPRLRRVAPFLRKAASVFDSSPDPEPSGQDSGVDSAKADSISERCEFPAADLQHLSEETGPIVPFSALRQQGKGTPPFCCDVDSPNLAARLTTKLSVFPGSPEDNGTLDCQSEKAVRCKSLVSKAVGLSARDIENLQPGQESFRDDRTSLPSQMGQGNLPGPISKAL